MVKQCNELLALIGIESDDKREIQGISCDSREVSTDWLFICTADKHQLRYLEEAAQKGAVTISELNHGNGYLCEDCKQALCTLIDAYYDSPARQLFVIGVTGTNGKTSVASYLRQMFTCFGKQSVLIGTNGIDIGNEHIDNPNTTPSVMVSLHTFLQAIKQGISIVIMEVSSHALAEDRLGFIRFDRLIYTNITQDHLDYHLTFTHYQYTKFKARFYLKENGRILLNQDRPEVMELLHLRTRGIITYGTKPAHVQLKNIQLTSTASSFEVGHLHFETELLSMNNVYNLGACIALFKSLGIHNHDLCEAVKQLKPVAGRLEVVQAHDRCCWIDFAHTPDALRKLLEFARQVAHGRIITIIGCGGERDHEKRHQMGTIASTLSDIAIFTADNPRHEKVETILQAMRQNVLNNVFCIPDRKKAIVFALSISLKSDIIIVAGKGNEQFLIVNDEKIPYNDKAFIKEYNREDLS